MKLPPKKKDAFLRNVPPAMRGALFYGPNTALVEESVAQLAAFFAKEYQLSNPLSTDHYHYSDIKSSPELLLTALQSISLFGDQRFIYVSGCGPSLSKEILQAIANLHDDVFVVFTAGELPPSSSLRKAFEKDEHLAAIACYMDESADLTRYVSSYLSSHECQYERDVPETLVSLMPSDRLLIRSELEKLCLYVFPSKLIKTEDVLHVVSHASSSSLDRLCHLICNGDAQGVTLLLEQLLHEGVSPVVLVRSVQRYMMRLLYVKQQVEVERMSAASAMAALKPPVFFKQKDLFLQHIRRWSVSQLQQASQRIQRLECELKTTGSLPSLQSQQVIMGMAMAR